mgnify:CR=1 FL=1
MSESSASTNNDQPVNGLEENSASSDIYFGKGVMDSILEKVDQKQALLSRHWFRYLLRSIMAGALICLFVTFSLQVKTDLGVEFNKALSNLFAAIAFSMALVFIVFTNSELLTSNFMYFTVGQHYRRIPLSNTLKVLTVCLVGNILGCIIVASLVWSADLLQQPFIETLNKVLHTKTVASGPWKIFINAIFANFFINAAILVSMQIKEGLGKIIILMMGVTVFVYMGYEHVIANAGIYSLGVLFSPDNSNILLMIKALLYALLGNFVGGGLAVGLFYAYLNDSRKKG